MDTQSTTNQHANGPDSPVRTGFELTESYHRMTDMLKCKWTIAIVNAINEGSLRPSEIQATLPGLSSKVLTDRLKKLESFGVLNREAHDEVPPRVEYTLTDRGHDLYGVLSSVIKYIGRWEE